MSLSGKKECRGWSVGCRTQVSSTEGRGKENSNISSLRSLLSPPCIFTRHSSLDPFCLSSLAPRHSFPLPLPLLPRHDHAQALLVIDEVVGVLGVLAQIDLHPVNLAVEFAGMGATSGLGFNDRFDASLSNRFDERLVIALGLIGIVAGKVADRLVKNAARTHVARNHGGVARARVGSR